MAKNVLFLIHGMGWNLEQGVGAQPWFGEVDGALRAAWSSFPSLRERPFDTYIELVPLSYDKVFRDYVGAVSQAADKLRSTLGDAQYAKVVSTIAGADAEEQDFFWANVMDVLLYRYGGDLYRAVHVAIGKQIAERVLRDWDGASASATQFSIMSHSLGTAAVHGALNRLGGGKIAGSDALMLGGNFQLHSYITLANVSRVLWRGQGSIYDKTIIRPQATGAKYVRTFVNVRHIADPVPAPLRFSPSNWGTAYREVLVQHVRAANVHGYTHYLEHPRAAAAIFQPLLPPGLLAQAEIDAVAATYRDVDNDDPQKRAKVEQVVQRLAQDLKQAFDDETNLFGDSVELLGRVIRTLWRSRKELSAVLGAVS